MDYAPTEELDWRAMKGWRGVVSVAWRERSAGAEWGQLAGARGATGSVSLLMDRKRTVACG